MPGKQVLPDSSTKLFFARALIIIWWHLVLEWYQQNFTNNIPLEQLIEITEKTGSSNALTARPQAFKYQNIEDAFINIKAIIVMATSYMP